MCNVNAIQSYCLRIYAGAPVVIHQSSRKSNYVIFLSLFLDMK